MKLLRLINIVLAVTAVAASAPQDFPRILGRASITVDGDLADWSASSQPIAITWRDPLLGGIGPSNVTAALRGFADDDYLYLAIAVSDSHLVFQDVPFNEAWRNDAVEVYFSASDGNTSHAPAGTIRVSSDAKGRTLIEGFVSLDGSNRAGRFAFPNLWEALGARAALTRTPTGYTVELAIPREALGWFDSVTQQAFKLNVRVFDSDGSRPCASVLGWAEDPYNTSPDSDELYTTLHFTAGTSPAMVSAKPDGDPALRLIVREALLRLTDRDADSALSLLTQREDDPRIWPILGSTQLAAHQVERGMATLSKIAAEGRDDQASLWAVERLALGYLRKGDTYIAKQQYRKLNSSPSASVRDIGTAGLIDCALAEGDADSIKAIYLAVVQAGGVPASKSAERIGRWLRGQKQFAEASSIYVRIAASEVTSGMERTWALSQLQFTQAESGDIDSALATGWKLQASAPRGDPAAVAAFASLVQMFDYRVGASGSAESFSARFLALIKQTETPLDPARALALAGVLRRERKPGDAAGLYREVARTETAARASRAEAMLRLQQLHHEIGNDQASNQTGLRLQQAFPDALRVRFSSLKLLRDSCAVAGTPESVKQQCSNERARFARDLRTSVEHGSHAEAALASAYLSQLTQSQERNPDAAK